MFKMYIAALVKHNQEIGWLKKNQVHLVYKKTGQKLTQKFNWDDFS